MKELDIYGKGAIQMTAEALKWSLMIVVLLSVLFPMGAYLGVVGVFMLAVKARRTRKILAGLSEDAPVLAMLFAVFLSLLYSEDKLLSIGGAAVVCLNVGLYLVLAGELKNIGTKRYINILDTACILSCLFGLYQFASGDLNMPKSWVDEKNFGVMVRIYSTLLNPNIFAAYLAMNLSFGLARFRSLKEDIPLTAGIVLSSLCLLLTRSRGGFAAFCTSMLVLYLLKERKRGMLLYLAAMAGAYAAVNSADGLNRAGFTAIYQDSSSLYRMEIWKAALWMFLKNPLSGHGIGTTWYYLSSGSDKLYRYILHSHSIYLQVAAEMGAAGICAFAYLVYNKLLEGIRLLHGKAPGGELHVVRGFIACIAGIAVHGLVDAVVFVPAMSLIFMEYYALYRSEIHEHCTVMPAGAILPQRRKLGSFSLLDGKGALKLFWSKGTGKDKYKKEGGKAYQA